jgi:hypothetical protein
MFRLDSRKKIRTPILANVQAGISSQNAVQPIRTRARTHGRFVPTPKGLRCGRGRRRYGQAGNLSKAPTMPTIVALIICDRRSSSLIGRRSYLPFWLARPHDAAGFPLAREPRRCSRGSPGPRAALVCHGGHWPGPGESPEHHY